MVETWIADIHFLHNQECFQRHYNSLPKWRKDKADQLKTPLNKAQSVGAWILWQEIQRKYKLEKSEVFNLSHSGDYVLCSADHNQQEGLQLGCDIEKVKSVNLGVAKRFFCSSEYETIMAEDTPEKRLETFYRFWVLKESFVKATRKGFGVDPRSFEISLTAPPTLLKQPKEFTAEYYYQEYEWSEISYKMAVCATTPRIEREINSEFIDVLETIC